MLQKIALTLVLVFVAWMGFSYLNRMLAARRSPDGLPRARRRSAAAERRTQVYDTQKCSVCGAYVAAGSQARCDRPDCPY